MDDGELRGLFASLTVDELVAVVDALPYVDAVALLATLGPPSLSAVSAFLGANDARAREAPTGRMGGQGPCSPAPWTGWFSHQRLTPPPRARR